MSNASDFIIENGVLTKYVGPGGDVVIPEGVTGISWQAMFDLRKAGPITSIVLPNTITDIADLKLYVLDNVERLCLGGSVGRIAYKAFVDEDLNFWWQSGYDVDTCGEISWCRNLKTIDVAPQNMTFVVEDGVLFTKNKKKLVLCPSAREFYAVPDGTTHIMAGAFCGAVKLKKLTLPDSITNISGDAIRYTEIEYLRLPRSVEKLAKKAIDVPYVAFYHAAIAEHIEYPVYLGGPIDELPPKSKNGAVKGFLYARTHGITEINAYQQSYAEHVRKNPDSYLRNAESDDALLLWMMEDSLIPQKAFEKILAKKENSASPEIMAAMLSYQQQHFDVAGNDYLTLEDTPENKKAIALAKRREQIRNQKGIAGLTFVATGYLSHFGIYAEYARGRDLDDLKRYIEERGGVLRNSVSAKTDYLICNDPNSHSVKSRKAEDLDIPVITEEEFLKLCEVT